MSRMEILEYGNKDAETVLLQPVDEHDLENIDREVRLIREYAGPDFLLAAFPVGRRCGQLIRRTASGEPRPLRPPCGSRVSRTT